MTSLVLSAIAAVLFALWVALTLWDKRTQRRLYAAQRESERRWPMLAVEDFTEEDELAPSVCGYIRDDEMMAYCWLEVGHSEPHRDQHGDVIEPMGPAGSVPCRDCYEARRDGYPEAIHDGCRPYLVGA